jgi:YD repeat-containing protein
LEAYRYDGLSRIVEELNDFCKVDTRFDSLGRPFEETVSFAGTLAVLPHATVTREFDLAGTLVRLIYPSGRTLRYRRDPLHRLLGIEEVARGSGYPGSGTFTDPYDVLTVVYGGRRRARLQFANGASAVFSFDGVGRLVETANSGPGGILLTEQRLHDAVGNVRLRNALDPGAPGRGERFAYDSLYRLTECEAGAALPAFAAAALAPLTAAPVGLIPDRQADIDAIFGPFALAAPTQSLTYDPAANRLTEMRAGQPSRPYQVNLRDQYTDVAGEALTYDRVGNLRTSSGFEYGCSCERATAPLPSTPRSSSTTPAGGGSPSGAAGRCITSSMTASTRSRNTAPAR